jgi:endonuclease-3
MTTKERFEKVIEYFTNYMPVATTELHYKTPYELIVAVILSAQCTDKRVNIITPAFFRKFQSIEILSKATVDEIYGIIKSCSYPNSKAKNLLAMAKMLFQEFNSELPSDPEILQKLPGVGRKTANVLASVLYNKPVMAVDTHVFRVSARIGLTHNAKTPLDCEKQLVSHFSADILPLAHHWLILHGRYVCKARKPLCQKCGIKNICHYYKQNFPDNINTSSLTNKTDQ